jgi:hypothetical protein
MTSLILPTTLIEEVFVNFVHEANKSKGKM